MLLSYKSAMLILTGMVLIDLCFDWPFLAGHPTEGDVDDAVTYYSHVHSVKLPMAAAIPAIISLGVLSLGADLVAQPSARLLGVVAGSAAALYLFAGRIVPCHAALTELRGVGTPRDAFMPLLVEIATCHVVLLILCPALAFASGRAPAEKRKTA